MGRFSIFKHKSLVESYLRLEAEQSDMQKKLDKANAELSFIKRDKASTFNENVELTQKIHVLEEAFHNFSPILNLDYLKTAKQAEMQCTLWAAWEKVSVKDADSRKKRACDYVLTPLSINAERGCATFMGKSALKYHTTLRDCECQDFARRLQPCKHMYRLAHELNVEELDHDVLYVSNPSKLISVDCFNNVIKPNLSNAELHILNELQNEYCYISIPSTFKNLFKHNIVEICPEKYFLLNSFNREDLFSLLPVEDKFKRNSKKEDLIEHIIETYPEVIVEIEKLHVAVRISPYALHLKEYFSFK